MSIGRTVLGNSSFKVSSSQVCVGVCPVDKNYSWYCSLHILLTMWPSPQISPQNMLPPAPSRNHTLKKKDSTSLTVICYQHSWLRAGNLCLPSHLPTFSLLLIFWLASASSLHCCDFLCAAARLCSGNPVSLLSSLPHAFTAFPPALLQRSLRLCRWGAIAEHSTVRNKFFIDWVKPRKTRKALKNTIAHVLTCLLYGSKIHFNKLHKQHKMRLII